MDHHIPASLSDRDEDMETTPVLQGSGPLRITGTGSGVVAVGTVEEYPGPLRNLQHVD